MHPNTGMHIPTRGISGCLPSDFAGCFHDVQKGFALSGLLGTPFQLPPSMWVSLWAEWWVKKVQRTQGSGVRILFDHQNIISAVGPSHLLLRLSTRHIASCREAGYEQGHLYHFNRGQKPKTCTCSLWYGLEGTVSFLCSET